MFVAGGAIQVAAFCDLRSATCDLRPVSESSTKRRKRTHALYRTPVAPRYRGARALYPGCADRGAGGAAWSAGRADHQTGRERESVWAFAARAGRACSRGRPRVPGRRGAAIWRPVGGGDLPRPEPYAIARAVEPLHRPAAPANHVLLRLGRADRFADARAASTRRY